MVDVYICWLWEKLEQDFSQLEYLVIVWGFGYCFGQKIIIYLNFFVQNFFYFFNGINGGIFCYIFIYCWIKVIFLWVFLMLEQENIGSNVRKCIILY